MPEVADEVSRIATEAGVTILRNDAVTVSGLQFIGLDDFWGTNFHPRATLAKFGYVEDPSAATQNIASPQNAPTASIALCHNPDVVDLPVWSNYEGWILAGHTHGGQCKPPFLPPPELPVKNKLYTAGKFRLAGNRNMYISRGVGHLLRVRFNVRPEIPVFTLRREA